MGGSGSQFRLKNLKEEERSRMKLQMPPGSDHLLRAWRRPGEVPDPSKAQLSAAEARCARRAATALPTGHWYKPGPQCHLHLFGSSSHPSTSQRLQPCSTASQVMSVHVQPFTTAAQTSRWSLQPHASRSDGDNTNNLLSRPPHCYLKRNPTYCVPHNSRFPFPGYVNTLTLTKAIL